MAEQQAPAYKVTAKRGETVVLETAVRAENLRNLVKTLNAEMLKVEYTPLDELPEALRDL